MSNSNHENKTNALTREEALRNYIETVNTNKKNMMDKMSKQDMVDLIFKQNNMLSQQSSQMLEVVDLANNIELITKVNEAKKCNANKKIENECVELSLLQQQQLDVYEHSTKIQIVLFILFILVLAWLIYHYSSMC